MPEKNLPRVEPSAVAPERLDLPRKPQPDSSRHTPGPWRISSLDSRTIGPERGLTAHGTTVTQLQAVARITERGAESEANARLIAAAPDLFDVLKAVMVLNDTIDLLAGNETIAAAARSAIAKAEGR